MNGAVNGAVTSFKAEDQFNSMDQENMMSQVNSDEQVVVTPVPRTTYHTKNVDFQGKTY